MQKPKLLRTLNHKIQNFILLLVDTVYIPFKSYIPQQIFRYGVCGGGNLILDWVLYFIFYHYVFAEQIVDLCFISLSPHIASFVFTFPITFVTGFWLLRYVSFSDSVLKGRVQIVRYLFVVLSNILFTYLFLKFFVESCGFFPTPSKMLITFITTIYSFLMQKYFSFKIK